MQIVKMKAKVLCLLVRGGNTNRSLESQKYNCSFFSHFPSLEGQAEDLLTTRGRQQVKFSFNVLTPKSLHKSSPCFSFLI